MRLTHFPSAVAGRPLHQRSRGARIVRRGLIAAGIVALALLVIFGAGIAIILSGPTEIGFLRSRIETALQKRLGADYTVKVGRAAVGVDPVLGFIVEVDDVEVHDSEQSIVALAPATRVAVDPMALFRFKLAVSTVELSNAELSLVRSDKGEVYLGNADTAHAAARKKAAPPAAIANGPGDGGFPDLFNAMQILDRGLEPSINAAIDAGFSRFSFVGGTIDVWDAALGRERSFPSTDLSVEVEPYTGNVNASFATSGYGGRWTANFERTSDSETGERLLSGVFSQLTLADIFPRIGEKASLFSADIPLYGRANVTFAADGAVKDASVRLDVGAGMFVFGENRETLILDEATVKLRWDTANKVVILEPSPFYFGNTRGVVTGTIRPEGEPGDRRYAFDVETRGAILASSDAGGEPIVAERIAVSGVADLPGKLIRIESLVAITADGSLAAAGSLGLEGKTPSLAMAASITPMSAATLKQLWVPFIASGARRWVMQHVIDGRVSAAHFEAAIPPGILWNRDRPPMPDGALRLDVRLDNVSFTTFGDLPPVINASGNAVLAGATFGVDMEKGEVKLPSGATVEVAAGAFAVDNVFQRNNEGVVEVQLTGDAALLGEIADAKPFRTLERRNVAPSDLSGDVNASVSVRLPLKPGITESDIDWKVTINGTNLASKVPVEGRTFSDADVTISVTPDEVTVNGKARIDGVMADVAMSQPITMNGVSAGPGQQTARFTLDQAARTRLGIGLDEVLGGTVGALVSSIGGGVPGQHYDLDLTQARVVIPGVGWSKGVGVPAKLSFDLKPAQGGFTVDDIVLTGSGFSLEGTARLDADHGLVSADISQMALRTGDSIALKLTRTKNGYAINARGASFDARGVISHVKGNNDSGGTADISVDAQIDEMTGFNDEVMSGAKVSFASVDGTMQKLMLSGTVDGSPLSIAYSDLADSASLRADTADAGSIFRFIDLYTKVSGGMIAISGDRQGPAGPLAGTFQMDNFDLLNEPAVARMVSTGPAARANVNPGRLHFDRMVAKFRKTNDAINIDDALLRGAVVGATFNGRLDLARSNITINGTYIPAYAFNNAFGKLPLIGLVLGGGNRGGLIGVTFKIDGPISGPRVYFNPLSAVAPGIFRKIFEFH